MTEPAPVSGPITIENIDRLLGIVNRSSRPWTVLVLAAAVLSAFSVSSRASGYEWTVALTPITVLLIALVWLPAVVNIYALTGGKVKTPAGEASVGGLLDLLRSLDPAAQRGALPAVIAALDTGPTKNDPGVTRLRNQLQGDLDSLPVDAEEAEKRLVALAREYEAVRGPGGMPSGPDRTFKMTQIVTEARGLVRAANLQPRLSLEEFQQASPGDRIIALATIQARPAGKYVPIIVEAIANANKPFEQYHGLIAGLNVIPFASSTERDSIREAVTGRMEPGVGGIAIDLRDPERFRLAEQLLRAIDSGSSPRPRR